MFTPIFLWDSIPTWLQHIFLNGLVQPPTRTTIMTVQPVQQKDLEAAKALWNLRLVLAQQHFPPFRSIMFLFSQTSELARHTSHISLLYHVSIYIYIYVFTYVCMYLYIHIKEYKDIYTHIYLYIHIHSSFWVSHENNDGPILHLPVLLQNTSKQKVPRRIHGLNKLYTPWRFSINPLKKRQSPKGNY